VAALVGMRVYDGTAPSATSWPYILIDSPTEVESGSAMGMRGFANTVSAHAFSKVVGYDAEYGEGDEARAIVAAMDAAVRTSALTLTGHTAASLRLDFATLLVEPDGTRHAPVRFRATTWEM